MYVIGKREVTAIVDVTCDLCGKSCMRHYLGEDSEPQPEFVTIKGEWGYGAKRDGSKIEAHICEDCYETLPFLDKIRETGLMGLMPYVS